MGSTDSGPHGHYQRGPPLTLENDSLIHFTRKPSHGGNARMGYLWTLCPNPERSRIFVEFRVLEGRWVEVVCSYPVCVVREDHRRTCLGTCSWRTQSHTFIFKKLKFTNLFFSLPPSTPPPSYIFLLCIIIIQLCHNSKPWLTLIDWLIDF